MACFGCDATDGLFPVEVMESADLKVWRFCLSCLKQFRLHFAAEIASGRIQAEINFSPEDVRNLLDAIANSRAGQF